MIEDTIKTQVNSKTFLQELDQEATQLKGKVTLGVSGVSFSRSDLSSVLGPKIQKRDSRRVQIVDKRT